MFQLLRGNQHTGEKGVITVEACISLPIFLCFFFLLLYLTKAACILLSLDNAAGQTAKHLAAASYPLTFINEYVDERMENASIINIAQVASLKLTDKAIGSLQEDSLTGLLGGGIKEQAADALFQTIKSGVPTSYYEGLDSLIKNTLLTQYEDLANQGKYLLAAQLVTEYLDPRYVDPEKLNIRLVELPKSQAEYEHRRQHNIYQEIEVLPDRDFTSDDVVIQLEYELNVPIPFWRDRTAKLRATAIERAWTYGGNGVYTSDREGLDWLKKGQPQVNVYKARTGQRYHSRPDCQYLQKSCLTLSREEAGKMGLTPHVNCPNRF